jgi:hypothetical protein
MKNKKVLKYKKTRRKAPGARGGKPMGDDLKVSVDAEDLTKGTFYYAAAY